VIYRASTRGLILFLNTLGALHLLFRIKIGFCLKLGFTVARTGFAGCLQAFTVKVPGLRTNSETEEATQNARVAHLECATVGWRLRNEDAAARSRYKRRPRSLAEMHCR